MQKKLEQVADIVEMNGVEKVKNIEKFKYCPKFQRGIKVCLKSISMACHAIFHNAVFEGFILLTIASNCVLMAMNPTGTWGEKLDIGFLAVYTVECVVKILGLGFLFNKGAYLRDAWNVLDFIIVVPSYAEYIFGSKVDLKVLRVLRILRPLKSISKVQRLKIVVSAVVSSIPMLANTLIIMVFFLLVFAIAGVQLFSGGLT